MAIYTRKSIPQENVNKVESMLGLTHKKPMYGIAAGGIGLNYQESGKVLVRVEYIGVVDEATANEIMRLLNGGAL